MKADKQWTPRMKDLHARRMRAFLGLYGLQYVADSAVPSSPLTDRPEAESAARLLDTGMRVAMSLAAENPAYRNAWHLDA